MEYTWSFSNLKAIASQGEVSDAVVSIDYRLGYGDYRYMAYRRGTIEFAPADSENFTPFSEITESQMRQWVENALGAELDAIKVELEQAVANPTTERELPWLES